MINISISVNSVNKKISGSPTTTTTSSTIDLISTSVIFSKSLNNNSHSMAKIFVGQANLLILKKVNVKYYKVNIFGGWL